jgi:hypothetical protein
MVQRPALPIIKTCIEAWRIAIEAPMVLMRLAVAPLVWLLVFQLGGQLIAVVAHAPAMEKAIGLSYVVLIPFDIAWLRFVLLDERPAAIRWIRFGSYELRFLAYSVAIPALSFLPALILGTITYASSGVLGTGHTILLGSATFAAVIAGIYTSTRMWLVYPELAISILRTLSEPWSRTHGCVLRIFAIAMLVDIPLLIIGAPIAGAQPRTEVGRFVIAAAQMPIALASGAVYRGAQAIVYRTLSRPEL